MKRERIYLILVCLISAWALLYKLDYQPMFLWDESRQANNAMEMAESGNFLYPTYEGQPDFWNTKPHLLVAIQAVIFKIAGPGLIQLRLPSALAAVMVIVLWFRFLQRRKLETAGYFFVLILLTCAGFNAYHVSRTGDYDALLLLFLSGAIIEWYSLTFEGYNTGKTWRFAGFMTLAVLIKSLAAVLWVPVFASLLIFVSNSRVRLLRGLIFPVTAAISVVAVYYFGREWLTPGYLSAVFENEITGRYLKPNEGHESPWHYYFTELSVHYFQGFIYFLILAIPAMILFPEWRRKLGFFLSGSLIFLIIISFSATRIHWYMAPVFPLLSLCISIPLALFLQGKKWLKWTGILASLALVIVAFNQNEKLWKVNTGIDSVYPQYVLQQAEKQGRMPYEGTWLRGNYYPIEKYYSGVFKEKGIAFKHTDKLDFNSGDTVYFYNFNYNDSLHHYYQCRQIRYPDENIKLWVFVIDSAKQISAAETGKP